MTPFPLPVSAGTAIRVAIVALLAAVVFAAGWWINGWRWESRLATLQAAHSASLAEYQQRAAQGEAQARQALQTAAQAARKASDAYQTELAALRGRPVPVRYIRLRCNNSPGALPAGGGGSATAGSGAGPAPGVVPGAGGGDSGQPWDAGPLNELAERCERVAAGQRALEAAWPK